MTKDEKKVSFVVFDKDSGFQSIGMNSLSEGKVIVHEDSLGSQKIAYFMSFEGTPHILEGNALMDFKKTITPDGPINLPED